MFHLTHLILFITNVRYHGNMGELIYITNPTSYERVGDGIISGSSQVSLGGDLSGGDNALQQ